MRTRDRRELGRPRVLVAERRDGERITLQVSTDTIAGDDDGVPYLFVSYLRLYGGGGSQGHGGERHQQHR